MTRANSLPLAVATLVVAIAAASCHAGNGQTVHAWKRTFYAYNALEQPLRPYFVPRRPGDCSRETRYGGPGCPYPPSAAMGFEPVHFERLGHIPNELGVETGAAAR